jgi:hypothetical protein
MRGLREKVRRSSLQELSQTHGQHAIIESTPGQKQIVRFAQVDSERKV